MVLDELFSIIDLTRDLNDALYVVMHQCSFSLLFNFLSLVLPWDITLLFPTCQKGSKMFFLSCGVCI